LARISIIGRARNTPDMALDNIDGKQRLINFFDAATTR
jgi:hypothetical protein